MNPWKMIISHRYQEAAASYEARLKSDPDNPDLLSAHAAALLCLGHLQEALKEYQRANDLANRRLKGETQPYLEKIGSVFWLLGRRDEALQTFRTAIDGILDGSIKFADNAGGVSQGILLWYAGVTSGNEKAKSYALNYLRKLAKKSRIKEWPGVLALYVLGEKTQADVFAAVCGSSDINKAINQAKTDLLTRRRITKALFYIATLYRDENNEEQCREKMISCASLENPVLEIEWYLAREETKAVMTLS